MWKMRSVLGEEVQVLNRISDLVGHSNRKDDILISVAEACINAIEHGNMQEKDKEIIIEFKECVSKYAIRIYDSGTGYDTQFTQPDIDDKINGNSSRGWGLYLMNTFTDEINYGYAKDHIFYVELNYFKENELWERGKSS